MIKKCLTIISGLVFTATTGIIYPINTKAIEDIEPVEVVSMRSEYEKHYDNGDGTYTAYIDTVPLHYYENGEWLDIDNTLIQDENGNYVNRSNSMKVTLSSETSISPVNAIDEASNNNNQMVSIDYNDYSLSWSLIDTKIADEKLIIKNEPAVMSEDLEADNMEISDIQADIADNEIESVISYEKIYPVSEVSINEQESVERDIGMNKLNTKISESVNNLNSSVSYNDICETVNCKVDIQSNYIKETLILESPDNLLEEYSYFIQSDRLVAELFEDNSVVFSNGDENIFTIPAPFMFDSSECAENNYDIKVTLEESDNGYIYTFSPDMNWLADKSRVYPIMIDPSVTIDTDIGLSLCYNSESEPLRFFSDVIKLSNISGSRKQAFISLPVVFNRYNKKANILSAKLKMWQKANDSSGNSYKISVYRLNKNIYDKCWYYSSSTDCSNTGKYAHYLDIDITKLVASWLNYYKTNDNQLGVPCNGIKLITDSNMELSFYGNNDISAYQPYYFITYYLSSDYTLPYAPSMYNRYEVSDHIYNSYNLQNRMNCYAYALQTYYNGGSAVYGRFKLRPGEIGIGKKGLDNYICSNYNDLCTYYDSFDTMARNILKAYGSSSNNFKAVMSSYLTFIRNQMYRDAEVMNVNMNDCTNEVIHNTNGVVNFSIPNNMDLTSERLIALVSYVIVSANKTKGITNYILDYHYYLRNGNGTCPNGHGDKCSMWSHKPGGEEVRNTYYDSSDRTYKVLCDKTIYDNAYKIEHVTNDDYRAYYDSNNIDNVLGDSFYSTVRFFKTNKDVHYYKSSYGDYSGTGATPYKSSN